MNRIMKLKNEVTLAALYIIAALVCVFTLPYLFPPDAPSSSYAYGFGNRAGQIILALFALAAMGYAFIKKDNAEAILTGSKPEKLRAGKTFIAVLLLTFLGCVFLWRVTGGNLFVMHEGNYFVSSLYRIYFGKTIYKDFPFLYGPALLYLPYFIYKVLHFMTITDAYMLSLAICQLTGLSMLYYILSNLFFGEKEKKIIFIALAVFSFPIQMGENYALFRFVPPFFCLMFLHENRAAKPVLRAVTAALFTLLNMLISPEIGLVFFIVLLVYLAFSFAFSGEKTNIAQAALAVIAFLFVIKLFPDMFTNTGSFLGGAINWPFVPCSTLVLYFIAVLCASYGAGTELKNIKNNLFDLCFVLLAFGYIPGALGRCDPGHVFFNGMFVFILAYIYLKQFVFTKAHKLHIVYGVCVLCSFTAVTFFAFKAEVRYYGFQFVKNNINSIPDFVIKPAEKRLGFNIKERLAEWDAKGGGGNLAETFKNIDAIAAPAGLPPDVELYVFLNKEHKYIDLKKGEDVVSQLEGIKPEYLLLPAGFDKEAPPVSDEAVDENEYINKLFLTYYPVKPTRRYVNKDAEAAAKAFKDYINARYISTGASAAGYEIFKRR